MTFNNRSELSFCKYLWNDPENKRILLFAGVGMLISFIWLKIIYPYPNFMPPDSNSYVEAAYFNKFINTWAIGYSKFLRLVSSFTNSHFALVLIQYALLQSSIVYFLMTVRYLLSPNKWVFRILVILSTLNPLVIHLSNFVSSDALFTTLSLIWFTQLLWIICMPGKNLLLWHAVVILFAFMVRYSGIFYPFVSLMIIFFSTYSLKSKLIGIGQISILLFVFIGATQLEYFKKTGTTQYSAFGGWQIAANALYGYAYAKPDPPENVPFKFRELHTLVNMHMDSLRKIPESLRPDEEVAVYYLWDFKSPLKVLQIQHFKKDSSGYFKQWAWMAPLYASYGAYLIKQHPREFLKYYILPNLKKYYAPPTKFMGTYNLGNIKVDPIIVRWFGWKNNELPSYFKDKQIKIAEVFPVVFAVCNVAFILSLLALILLGEFRHILEPGNKIIITTAWVMLCNMTFSVFAAPIELRYQIFVLLISLCVMILMVSRIIQLADFRVNRFFSIMPFIKKTSA